MKEIKYPIYKFSLRWNQDDYQNNSVGCSIMYKEIPTKEKLNNDLEEYKNYIEQLQIEKNHPVINWLEEKYEYYEDEVWMLNWFNHITYNLFETDEEVERSFRNFIDRKMQINRKNGHGYTEHHHYNKDRPFYCFMGAEDEWRWKICRCDDCKRIGKITISH